jgi:hypothetical protein
MGECGNAGQPIKLARITPLQTKGRGVTDLGWPLLLSQFVDPSDSTGAVACAGG